MSEMTTTQLRRHLTHDLGVDPVVVNSLKADALRSYYESVIAPPIEQNSAAENGTALPIEARSECCEGTPSGWINSAGGLVLMCDDECECSDCLMSRCFDPDCDGNHLTAQHDPAP